MRSAIEAACRRMPKPGRSLDRLSRSFDRLSSHSPLTPLLSPRLLLSSPREQGPSIPEPGFRAMQEVHLPNQHLLGLVLVGATPRLTSSLGVLLRHSGEEAVPPQAVDQRGVDIIAEVGAARPADLGNDVLGAFDRRLHGGRHCALKSA